MPDTPIQENFKYKKQGKILLHYQMKGANTQYDKLKPEHNNKM